MKNAKRNFEKASIQILQNGFTPINPIEEVPYVEGWTWEQYMLKDIEILFGCDSIYMLSNWVNSRGAKIEHAIAKECGKTIVYEQQTCPEGAQTL